MLWQSTIEALDVTAHDGDMNHSQCVISAAGLLASCSAAAVRADGIFIRKTHEETRREASLPSNFLCKHGTKSLACHSVCGELYITFAHCHRLLLQSSFLFFLALLSGYEEWYVCWWWWKAVSLLASPQWRPANVDHCYRDKRISAVWKLPWGFGSAADTADQRCWAPEVYSDIATIPDLTSKPVS